MKFFFLLLFSVLSTSAFSQDVNALLKEANTAELLPNEGLALYRYKEILKTYPTNVIALSKASELCCRIGSREANTTTKEAWYKAALQYATKAVVVDPKSDVANVSMAMSLGKSSMNKSGKEKIKNAKLLKRHLDIALATNPSNYLALHILARWHYELSNISAVERTAAKIFVGTLPDASLKDAIRYFEKSRSITRNFILNNVELAKAYHENEQDDKAIAVLREVQTMPINTEDDPALKKVAQELIQKWK